MPRTIGPAQQSVLQALTDSESPALTTADLVTACGLTERRIRQVTDALALRDRLVITRGNIGQKGVGEYGSLNWRGYDDDADVIAAPTALVSEHDGRRIEWFHKGMPTFGRLYWLPAKRAEWEEDHARLCTALRGLL